MSEPMRFNDDGTIIEEEIMSSWESARGELDKHAERLNAVTFWTFCVTVGVVAGFLVRFS